jgi:hypothetical protein
VLVARRRIFAAANRLNINDLNGTSDDSEPYFTSECFDADTSNLTHSNALSSGKDIDAVTMDLDNPIEFVCAETLMAQYSLLIGCQTTETVELVCMEYDLDNSSHVRVQLTSQPTSCDKQMNFNRSCIARVFFNTVETTQSEPPPILTRSMPPGKRMCLSIDDISFSDMQNVEVSLGFLGNTFLNLAKMAAFVLVSFSSVNCKHWKDEKLADRDAQIVVTGMSWNPPVGYDISYTINRDVDSLLAKFVVIHTAYSMSSDFDQHQS